MINPNDSIRYTNVISRKYEFQYQELENVFNDFVQEVIHLGATIKGPLFYSVNNVPMDEVLLSEFFIPIHEDDLVVPEDMRFHSYFSVENMISIYVHNHFETKTEVAYRLLLDYISDNELEQVTPIFHVISGDHSMQYAMIKIGVQKVLNMEPASNI
ncbi:DUF5085 family protein [Radiobacillus kanasensis]|uniref:DUF5085 family protein n=1 Tax=Radiobacillus kanasensis TaxID=2844358 RepID=UPI001E49BD6B|nr:DUF5085 family protein [Radiobacillus kanasensis]UFT99209.1 DUF5085 family protein [Radiobacillus kanasensis]